MAGLEGEILIRVRYSETDQMGTFYNSRALEWFECGRSELMRDKKITYAEMENRGIFLPLTEAYVKYLGRARYDDLLRVRSRATMEGRARLRFDVVIQRADSGAEVVRGYTIHAFAGPSGSPIRPPAWFVEMVEGGGREQKD